MTQTSRCSICWTYENIDRSRRYVFGVTHLFLLETPLLGEYFLSRILDVVDIFLLKTVTVHHKPAQEKYNLGSFRALLAVCSVLILLCLNFLNMGRGEHNSISRLEEGRVEKKAADIPPSKVWNDLCSTRQTLALFWGQPWGDCWEIGWNL